MWLPNYRSTVPPQATVSSVIPNAQGRKTSSTGVKAAFKTDPTGVGSDAHKHPDRTPTAYTERVSHELLEEQRLHLSSEYERRLSRLRFDLEESRMEMNRLRKENELKIRTFQVAVAMNTGVDFGGLECVYRKKAEKQDV